MKNALLNMELRSLIISELTQGKELANQLEINLKTPSSSPEICDFLVNKIIDSYNKVLSMVKHVHALQDEDRDTISPLTDTTLVAVGDPDSMRSPSGSPISQDSDMEIKDYDKNISDASKKRKAMPRWTKQVEVSPGSVSEGPSEDGHNWRKYGQKDILGAKYPRGYYRCTQRNAQGCLATKQVQRKDDNPTIFEITYRGRHTCTPRISSKSASSPREKQKQPTTKSHINNKTDITYMHQQDQHALLLVSNFEASLREEIDNIDNVKNQDFPEESPFNFFSSPNNVINVANYPFSPSLIDENLALHFPCTSSPCPDYYTENLNVQITDQEMMDRTPATTSSGNSINAGLDYPFSIFANDFHIW